MRIAAAIFCLLIAGAIVRGAPAAPTPTVPSPTVPTPVLTKTGEGPGPAIDGRTIHLLTGTAEREVNSLTLPASSDHAVSSVEVKLTLRMDSVSEGLGILLLNADVVGKDAGIQTVDQWEEPNRLDAIGIGLDSKDPPSLDPYDENGNIHDRPQREASVHVDGREILNRQCADFATGRDVPVLLRLVFVPGGARLTLTIAGQAVYGDELLPGVRPFVPRLAMGARTGGKSKLDVIGLTVTPGPAAGDLFAPPKHFVLFDKTPISLPTTREPNAIVSFDDLPKQIGRVIATLTLDAPPAGFDKRDCRGALYLYTDDRQRFELFRFRTPFSKAWQWKTDVTDFLPLLRGQQKFGLMIDTWRDGGFIASLTLDFYAGKPERLPIGVVNLWQGEPILGDGRMPTDAFFDTKTVIAPPNAQSARARIVVTGHGNYPNDKRAGEQLALGRALTVNDQTFTNLLWKTDNYLNPCRPQRGPWKEDRAGWGPGSIVDPWLVELTPILKQSRELTMSYRITDDYVNEHVGKGDPPTHWVDGQVIFYSDAPSKN